MNKISLIYLENVSKQTQGFQLLNLSQTWEIKILQLMMLKSFTSFGITLKHGETFANMMNIIQMMRRNALKKGGWKNKIKNLEKNMIKMKEKEYLI